MTELSRSLRDDSADPVVIEQFFANGIRGGEERLMLAVLQDAVKCFQKHVLAQYVWEKMLLQEAEDWILAKNTGWYFSFENICETLQLNPEYIRRGLLAWKETKRKPTKTMVEGFSHQCDGNLSRRRIVAGSSSRRFGRTAATSSSIAVNAKMERRPEIKSMGIVD